MDHATRFRQLLADLGEACGLEGLAPDPSGYCCLSVDEATEVQLQLNPHTGDLTVFSSLGRIDGPHAAALNANLLHANLFWQGTAGATIGVDPRDQAAIIARQVPVERFDGPGFVDLMDQFVRTAEAWRAYILDLQAKLEGGDRPAAAPLPPGGSLVWG